MPRGMGAGVPERGLLPSGSGVPFALLGAAAAAATMQRRRRPFAGSGSELVEVQNSHEAFDGEVRCEPKVAMCFIQTRKYVRIRDRDYTYLRRGKKPNKSAKKRFLIKPDGTVWRRQAGLRHLKSKKTPAHLKRLSRMVPIKKSYYKKLWQLIKYKPPTLTAADFIMRKFNEKRLHKGEWTSDRKVGTALWT